MTVDREHWSRPQRKGWREGNAAAFVGLSPEESAYVEMKLRLADAVKALREGQALTQVELATRLGSSQSRVAKIEKGDPSVSIDLLTRSMLALGATSRDIAHAISGLQ